MASESTRPSLVSRLRQGGDDAAWTEFEARYRELIRRFCRRKNLQAADAEDVCQLVFLGLSRSLRTFAYDPGHGRFRDYVARVVQNTIHHFRARSARDPRLVDNDALDALARPALGPVDPDFEDEWTQHHFRLAMRAIRARTTRESLEVFERLLAGESVARVAAGRGMTEEAVHKVKQRVGERLRQEIARQVRDEDLDGPPRTPSGVP